jgi:hypothetical protein
MPLLSRTAVHTACYALSVLAIFCSNASAAEPITLALLRPQLIAPVTPLTKVRNYCPPSEQAYCRRALRDCLHINLPSDHCHNAYHECMEHCHVGD